MTTDMLERLNGRVVQLTALTRRLQTTVDTQQKALEVTRQQIADLTMQMRGVALRCLIFLLCNDVGNRLHDLYGLYNPITQLEFHTHIHHALLVFYIDDYDYDKIATT